MCLANVLPIINLSANYHSEQLLFSSSLCPQELAWGAGGKSLATPTLKWPVLQGPLAPSLRSQGALRVLE